MLHLFITTRLDFKDSAAVRISTSSSGLFSAFKSEEVRREISDKFEEVSASKVWLIGGGNSPAKVPYPLEEFDFPSFPSLRFSDSGRAGKGFF